MRPLFVISFICLVVLSVYITATAAQVSDIDSTLSSAGAFFTTDLGQCQCNAAASFNSLVYTSLIPGQTEWWPTLQTMINNIQQNLDSLGILIGCINVGNPSDGRLLQASLDSIQGQLIVFLEAIPGYTGYPNLSYEQQNGIASTMYQLQVELSLLTNQVNSASSSYCLNTDLTALTSCVTNTGAVCSVTANRGTTSMTAGSYNNFALGSVVVLAIYANDTLFQTIQDTNGALHLQPDITATLIDVTSSNVNLALNASQYLNLIVSVTNIYANVTFDDSSVMTITENSIVSTNVKLPYTFRNAGTTPEYTTFVAVFVSPYSSALLNAPAVSINSVGIQVTETLMTVVNPVVTPTFTTLQTSSLSSIYCDTVISPASNDNIDCSNNETPLQSSLHNGIYPFLNVFVDTKDTSLVVVSWDTITLNNTALWEDTIGDSQSTTNTQFLSNGLGAQIVTGVNVPVVLTFTSASMNSNSHHNSKIKQSSQKQKHIKNIGSNGSGTFTVNSNSYFAFGDRSTSTTGINSISTLGTRGGGGWNGSGTRNRGSGSGSGSGGSGGSGGGGVSSASIVQFVCSLSTDFTVAALRSLHVNLPDVDEYLGVIVRQNCLSDFTPFKSGLDFQNYMWTNFCLTWGILAILKFFRVLDIWFYGKGVRNPGFYVFWNVLVALSNFTAIFVMSFWTKNTGVFLWDYGNYAMMSQLSINILLIAEAYTTILFLRNNITRDTKHVSTTHHYVVIAFMIIFNAFSWSNSYIQALHIVAALFLSFTFVVLPWLSKLYRDAWKTTRTYPSFYPFAIMTASALMLVLPSDNGNTIAPRYFFVTDGRNANTYIFVLIMCVTTCEIIGCIFTPCISTSYTRTWFGSGNSVDKDKQQLINSTTAAGYSGYRKDKKDKKDKEKDKKEKEKEKDKKDKEDNNYNSNTRKKSKRQIEVISE
jgi:uncharacterized membrane protein YgcG